MPRTARHFEPAGALQNEHATTSGLCAAASSNALSRSARTRSRSAVNCLIDAPADTSRSPKCSTPRRSTAPSTGCSDRPARSTSTSS